MGSSLAPVLDERRAGLAQVVHRGPADSVRHTAWRVRVGSTRETRPTFSCHGVSPAHDDFVAFVARASVSFVANSSNRRCQSPRLILLGSI